MSSGARIELLGPESLKAALARYEWRDASRAISRASFSRMAGDARTVPSFALVAWSGGRALVPAAIRDGRDSRNAQPEVAELTALGRSDRALVLGNFEEMSYGCLLAQEATIPADVFGSLIERLRVLAAETVVPIVAPFVSAVDALSFEAHTPLHRVSMAPRLRLDVTGHELAGHLALARSRVRTLFGRDTRRFAKARLRWRQVDIRDRMDLFSSGLSDVKARYGVKEPQALSRYRLSALIEDFGPSVRAFQVDVDGVVAAVSVGVMVGDNLDMWEVGLPEQAEHRLEAYVAAVIHAPLECALGEGARAIMLGTGSEVPKASRGAVREEMFGFVV